MRILCNGCGANVAYQRRDVVSCGKCRPDKHKEEKIEQNQVGVVADVHISCERQKKVGRAHEKFKCDDKRW